MPSEKSKVELIYEAFGRNTAMSCVAMGPLFPVECSKNMIFRCTKE